MHMLIGALMLMPLVGAGWVVMNVVNACIKKGNHLRPLAILVSVLVGGFCVWIGYFLAIEGMTEYGPEVHRVTYPVYGWILMITGGLIVLIGSYTALAATKEEIEAGEAKERLERMRKWNSVPKQSVTCPECGQKNLVPDPMDEGRMYRCARCKTRLDAKDRLVIQGATIDAQQRQTS